MIMIIHNHKFLTQGTRENNSIIAITINNTLNLKFLERKMNVCTRIKNTCRTLAVWSMGVNLVWKLRERWSWVLVWKLGVSWVLKIWTTKAHGTGLRVSSPGSLLNCIQVYLQVFLKYFFKVFLSQNPV